MLIELQGNTAKEIEKPNEKLFCYTGYLDTGEELLVFDNNEKTIIPIVKKLMPRSNLFFIILIGLFGFIFILIIIFVAISFIPSKKPIQTTQIPINTINSTRQAIIPAQEKIEPIKTEILTNTGIIEELEKNKDLKNNAEIEALRQSYEAQILAIKSEKTQNDLNDKIADLQNKLNIEVEKNKTCESEKKQNIETEKNKLFLIYLGEKFKTMCEEKESEICKDLFYKYNFN